MSSNYSANTLHHLPPANRHGYGGLVFITETNLEQQCIKNFKSYKGYFTEGFDIAGVKQHISIKPNQLNNSTKMPALDSSYNTTDSNNSD